MTVVFIFAVAACAVAVASYSPSHWHFRSVFVLGAGTSDIVGEALGNVIPWDRVTVMICAGDSMHHPSPFILIPIQTRGHNIGTSNVIAPSPVVDLKGRNIRDALTVMIHKL